MGRGEDTPQPARALPPGKAPPVYKRTRPRTGQALPPDMLPSCHRCSSHPSRKGQALLRRMTFSETSRGRFVFSCFCAITVHGSRKMYLTGKSLRDSSIVRRGRSRCRYGRQQDAK